MNDDCDDSESVHCDDPELIDRAIDGDERAFARLVDCNQEMLFRSMLRLLGCPQDAEEAVQEAFVRAFTRIDSFDGNSKFSTWLYRIAFNAAISGHRKKKPSVSLDQHVDDYGWEVADGDAAGVADGLLREENIRLVHRALDELSDEHRAVLVLRELDDLAYKEIGDVLGLTPGTVRSRLSRARSELRHVVQAIQSCVALT
ncbi:MAG: sigma-70 family RNA polymerase sigma factor [Pirellulaceae bacterium]|nr:sigma-70 family RNA polymerase sigma factor [Pirellulaceae bacterium]